MNLIRLNEGVLMKKLIHHEGYNYVLEYDNNSLIMYKEDIDEWMGDIEYDLRP